MLEEEILIEHVKRYPVLYDTTLTQYRDLSVRNCAWEEIAEQLNANAEDLKTKWGKLRNCYTNALKRRRKQRGNGSTPIAPWKFRNQMEFLLPYIESRNSNSLSSSSDGNMCSVNDSFSSYNTIKYENESTSEEVESNEICQQKTTDEMDELDHFFLSMSKQLKKLPVSDQIEIKFQLHKLIYEAEKKQLTSSNRVLMIPVNLLRNQKFSIASAHRPSTSQTRVTSDSSKSATSTTIDRADSMSEQYINENISFTKDELDAMDSQEVSPSGKYDDSQDDSLE
ncbi:uncharacterized protein ACR2FA_008736 [Aphomia sociella]